MDSISAIIGFRVITHWRESVRRGARAPGDWPDENASVLVIIGGGDIANSRRDRLNYLNAPQFHTARPLLGRCTLFSPQIVFRQRISQVVRFILGRGVGTLVDRFADKEQFFDSRRFSNITFVAYGDAPKYVDVRSLFSTFSKC